MKHRYRAHGIGTAALPIALILLQTVTAASAGTVARIALSGPQATLYGNADGLDVFLSVSQNTSRSGGRPVTQTFLSYELSWCDVGPWPMASMTVPAPPDEPPGVPCRTFASGYGVIPKGSFVAAKNGSWRLDVVPASVPGFRFEGSGELISLAWTANGERRSRFHGTVRSSFASTTYGTTYKQTGHWTEHSADAAGTVFGFALRSDADATMGYARGTRILIEK